MMQPTVYVKPITSTVLLMTWQHDVDKNDVTDVFNDLRTRLRETEQPLQIIVDITAQPIFPVQSIVSNAMHGVYSHPKLERWLVAGESISAKLIADALEKIRRRGNIVWCKTLDEAYQAAGVPQRFKL